MRLAVDDQISAGLDRITDGEMARVDFNLGFYERIKGLGLRPCSPLARLATTKGPDTSPSMSSPLRTA